MKNFYVFCGSNGTGKTTVIDMVKDELEKQGKKVLVTCEPGDFPISGLTDMKNRDYCKKLYNIDNTAHMLSIIANRRVHILYMKEWLEKNPDGILLVDRYLPCTFAYNYDMQIKAFDKKHFYPFDSSFHIVETLHSLITFDTPEFNAPTMTYLITLNDELALNRMKNSIKHNNDESINILAKKYNILNRYKKFFELFRWKYDEIDNINSEETAKKIAKSIIKNNKE